MLLVQVAAIKTSPGVCRLKLVMFSSCSVCPCFVLGHEFYCERYCSCCMQIRMQMHEYCVCVSIYIYIYITIMITCVYTSVYWCVGIGVCLCILQICMWVYAQKFSSNIHPLPGLPASPACTSCLGLGIQILESSSAPNITACQISCCRTRLV